jgi:hypothetical protein
MRKANRKLALHTESLRILDGLHLAGAAASAPPACTASCVATCGNIGAAQALLVTKAACCV